MILPVLKYGHPLLRQKGARVEAITPAITELIADMLETMYAAAGVGLAAQQIGRALQLMVIDVREVKDRPSTLELGGQSAEVSAFMPLVLISPEIKPAGDPVPGPEGCLSFPEIYQDITRPESVQVTALDATIPYSEPLEAWVLPDEDKIVAAAGQVLGSSPVTA